jgi:hypothetical protein
MFGHAAVARGLDVRMQDHRPHERFGSVMGRSASDFGPKFFFGQIVVVVIGTRVHSSPS